MFSLVLSFHTPVFLVQKSAPPTIGTVLLSHTPFLLKRKLSGLTLGLSRGLLEGRAEVLSLSSL